MAEKHKVRLLICDDHRLLTEALSILIERDPEIEIAAEPTADPMQAIELSRKLRPDVVLMDIDLKATMGGIEATREVNRVSPGTSVVILTSSEDDRLLVAAVEAGASGFVRKTEAVDKVIEIVKAAARDEILINSGLLARMLTVVAREREKSSEDTRAMGRLTAREIEILQLLSQGVRSEDVAQQLHIGLRTVQTHIHNILTKLGVRSRLEAVVLALRTGLMSASTSGE
jgi:DNA-binding NarL/FixJ family response regulator